MKIDISGLSDLKKRLTKLPERIEKNIMGAAVRAGANIIKSAAVANLGGKKTDIVVAKSRSPKGVTKFKIGTSGKKFYLMYRELGTRPHVIKIGKTKKFLADGAVVFGKVVQHPGQAPKPFLRPALDENAQKAVDAMAKKIKQRLEKEAAKR
jgi:HK97 gp10 family phage protein